MKPRPSARVCLVAYQEIAGTLEEREEAAGIAPRSWRWMGLDEWVRAVTRGLQRRSALEARP